MRVLAVALLLSACASNGTGRYLAVTDTSHGRIVWASYQTLEACERATVEVRNDTRCTTRQELRGRRSSR